MANGVQATTALSATTETKVYEVPAGYRWIGNISICNRNTTVAKVRLAVGSNAAMASGMYLEYNIPLLPAGNVGNVIERTGKILGSAQAIWVYSDSANVDVVIDGIEE